MKAIIQTGYGPPEEVLELREIEPPQIKDDQVLIDVRAAAVHAGDALLLVGIPYLVRLGSGLRRPRKGILGFDVAGVIEAVGAKVEGLAVGDAVFGEADGSCVELAVASPKKLHAKPERLSFEEAAACAVSGITALRAIRDNDVGAGQKVLVNGASGGVGTFAVQMAKARGAEVTAVCSGRNADLVRSIGADHVIDYTETDFTNGEERYDLVLDNVGKHSLAAMRRTVAPGGKLVPNAGTSKGRVFGPFLRMFAAFVLSLGIRKQGRPFVAVVTRSDLVELAELLESGAVKPIVAGTFPLEETAAAMRHLLNGHPGGKVVVAVGD